MADGILDSLLEAFNPLERRGLHGRWVAGDVGKLAAQIMGLPKGKFATLKDSGVRISRRRDGQLELHRPGDDGALERLRPHIVGRIVPSSELSARHYAEAALAQHEHVIVRRKFGVKGGRPDLRVAQHLGLNEGAFDALLEGAEGRVQEAIGHIEKGAFHRWLGKKEGDPITDADIKRGLAAGGHPAKMAQFAKAARKFGK